MKDKHTSKNKYDRIIKHMFTMKIDRILGKKGQSSFFFFYFLLLVEICKFLTEYI